MDQQAPQVPRVKLGTQGLEVSKLGLGCLGLTGAYNLPLDDEVGAAVVVHAFRRGVTFFDTSDYYGPLTNEILLGNALKLLPREQVQVATKFGLPRERAAGGSSWGVCGRPEYVRACCEASLHRLGLDYIDLYYQHRVDTTVPIEDTIGELKKLVEEGKVRYIGGGEAGGQHDEAIDHLLIACVFSREVWSRLLRRAGLQRLTPTDESALQGWWLSSRMQIAREFRRAFDSVVIVVSWNVWKERNDRTFDSRNRTTAQVCDAILDEFSECVAAGFNGLNVFTTDGASA